ncbi:MAG: PilZ domain-containing protein [Desulfobacteraceae bacterium]|nr:PilZ domain-containing protein [Desulfobacteraceae bacterium]
MKKRSCKRFNIPGITLACKEKSFFFFPGKYAADRYPVINLSRGGAKFLCNQRLAPGKRITIKLEIPGMDQSHEILASIKWISKNLEKSYRYQTGISFNSYGVRKNENSMEILSFLKALEPEAGE